MIIYDFIYCLIIFILSIISFSLLYKYQKLEEKILFLVDKNISNKNLIDFTRLKKKYLNNCSVDDIQQLVSYLINYVVERKEKENENKK